MSNETKAYTVKTENVMIGVPADKKDLVLAAVQTEYPTIETAKGGVQPTSFGLVSIPGTESYILCHSGRLKAPFVALVAAYAAGVIAGSALAE